MKTLEGRLALVTGASRGAGRGIACVLGERGATVYVSGRSTRQSLAGDGTPGTIEETAELVTARGGEGIAVRCDHTNDEDVRHLFARIERERGRLDLLVNNCWGGYEKYTPREFAQPFWKHDVAERWRGMFDAGLRAHLVSSVLATPLLMKSDRGLIVSTIAWDRDKHLGTLYYDVAKHAIVRMIFALSRELTRHRVAAIAIAPGFMRTERVLAAVSKDEGKFDFSVTESPEYVGRAIAALAEDPKVMAKTGRAFRGGDLAPEYGFTDVDGRQVPGFDIQENWTEAAQAGG